MSAERVRFVIFNRSVCFRVFETNGLQIYTTPINCATEHDHRFVWTSIELLEPPSRLCWVQDISVAFSLARRMFLLKLKLLEEICQWSLSSVHKRSDRGVSCSFWGRHASIKSLLADPLVRSCALWTTVLNKQIWSKFAFSGRFANYRGQNIPRQQWLQGIFANY